MSAGRRNRPIGGFTLIEVLVVVSVVGALSAAALTALGGARQVAQASVSASTMRQLAIGQLAYAAGQDGWLAGPNTSGARGIVTHGRSLEGWTTPSTPTTTHDWISPTLGEELGLSANRAERTAQIFERLACPRASRYADTTWGLSHDLDDFERVLRGTGFVQISYLSPAVFHYRPEGGRWMPRALARAGARAHESIPFPFRPPAGYRPRMERLARPDAKALVAEGTRYLTEQWGPHGHGLTLDFDVSPEPAIYGSFTSSGPLFHGSRAYGRAWLRSGDRNVDLSMRYFDREMHVAYFDGHVHRLGAGRVWSDPTAWYPRGSVFTGGDATPEVAGLFAGDTGYGRVD